MTIQNILLAFTLLWLFLLSLSLRKAILHYKTLSKIKKDVSLDDLLNQIVRLLAQQKKQKEKSDQKISTLEKEIKKTISKVGLVKFNPFNDQGGEQSFVLSLLDDDDSGLLITSLHGRDTTRVYAKKIKNGKTDNLQLSKEEKLSILQTSKIVK